MTRQTSFFALLGILFLALSLPTKPAAQTDITALVSQNFGIPMTDGYILVPDRPGYAYRNVPAARRPNERPQETAMRGWTTFAALNRYRTINPSFKDSLDLATRLLDESGRLYFLQQLGVSADRRYKTAEAFRDFMRGGADEFHRARFHQLMIQIYRADGPIYGTVKVLNTKVVEFGSVNAALTGLDIRYISGNPSGRGALGFMGFLPSTMPDHEERNIIFLRMDEKAAFVRSLSSGNDYGERIAHLVVAGTLTFGPTGTEWRPQALNAYHDSAFTRPIPYIQFSDIYEDIAKGRREKAAREAAQAQLNAQQQAIMAERAKAAREKLLAEITAEFSPRTLNILDLTLDMTETQIREKLSDRFTLSETISRVSRRNHSLGLSPCDIARGQMQSSYDQMQREMQKANERARAQGSTDDVSLTAAQRMDLRAFRARLVAGMKPECRPSLDPFGTSFSAQRTLANGVQDLVVVFLGSEGAGESGIVAITRTLNWPKGDIDVLGQLTEKFGKRKFTRGDFEAFWPDDPETYVALASDKSGELTNACFPQRVWARDAGHLKSSEFVQDCGRFLAASSGPTGAAMYLIDTGLLLSRKTSAETIIEQENKPPKITIDF